VYHFTRAMMSVKGIFIVFLKIVDIIENVWSMSALWGQKWDAWWSCRCSIWCWCWGNSTLCDPLIYSYRDLLMIIMTELRTAVRPPSAGLSAW